MAHKQTYNPCDDCQYSYSKNGQESDMCKACEFQQLLNKHTADVVEVVRCKDCVNRVEFDTNKFHCELTGYYFGEMGYCSDAVRTPQKER